MISYDEIRRIFATQLRLITDNDDAYNGYSFIIANEQQFEKDKRTNKAKTIYIVLHYLEATIQYGQTILPFTINVLGEENSISICQRLLLDYVLQYNLKENDDHTMQQFYTTPSVMNNYEEVYSGFRSLLYLQASFRITENALSVSKVYYKQDDDTYYEIPKIRAVINSSFQLDTQTFFNHKSMAISEGKVKTLTLQITSYLYNFEFYNKIFKLMFGKEENYSDNKFTLKVELSNGFTSDDLTFIYNDATSQNSIGELDSVAITFTRSN